MPQTLTADEVSTALEALPGWSGDTKRLHRTVPVVEQDRHTLTDAIAAVADEINHHPEVSTTADGLLVELWSHDAGGVTSRDVELATRLDRLFSGGVAWNEY